MAGGATPTSSAGHASAGANTTSKLTFKSDHQSGAGHRHGAAGPARWPARRKRRRTHGAYRYHGREQRHRSGGFERCPGRGPSTNPAATTSGDHGSASGTPVIPANHSHQSGGSTNHIGGPGSERNPNYARSTNHPSDTGHTGHTPKLG